jgi:hypothetical protein
MASKVKFTTPFGVAQYPHLNTPDTKGKRADGKYKTKLVLKGDDPNTQAFVQAIDKALVELKGSKDADLYRPISVDEETGEVTLTVKSKYAPAIFDAKNREARKTRIRRGSVIRILGEFVPFDDAPKYPDGGINARLYQVQIKELSGASGFDTIEDGYEYDPSDAEDEAANNANDDAEDGDSDDGSSSLDI